MAVELGNVETVQLLLTRQDIDANLKAILNNNILITFYSIFHSYHSKTKSFNRVSKSIFFESNSNEIFFSYGIQNQNIFSWNFNCCMF